MRYEGTVYRPPSEANSLIIQVTIGCSHNRCSFCSMYKGKKFRIRNLSEIFYDLDMARRTYSDVRRIFLADGDALILKTEVLVKILIKIKDLFPECERIGAYATPNAILNKSQKDLEALRDLGLRILYLGIESGSDLVLDNINKGVPSDELIKSGKRVIASGIKLSVTLISGLGGKGYIEEHAIESAKVINQIKPDYLGLLTLLIEEDTPLYKEIKENKFELLSPREVLIETKLLIESIDVEHTVFRSNHPSNYITLSGNLCKDKTRLLEEIDEALNENFVYRADYLRRL